MRCHPRCHRPTSVTRHYNPQCSLPRSMAVILPSCRLCMPTAAAVPCADLDCILPLSSLFIDIRHDTGTWKSEFPSHQTGRGRCKKEVKSWKNEGHPDFIADPIRHFRPGMIARSLASLKVSFPTEFAATFVVMYFCHFEAIYSCLRFMIHCHGCGKTDNVCHNG